MVAIIIATIAIPSFLVQRDGAREAAAESDLRNAASAATSCANDNGGSHANRGTAAQLQPYGFDRSDRVTYQNVAATANR
jgi:type II secretory pathway pseudopilin PulG